MIKAATMIMGDSIFPLALLAGIGVALATGPLGSFVVWRRMAYFGDASAHAAVLGVALALAFSLPLYLGVLLVVLAVAVLVSALAAGGEAMDTSLGVLAHSTLALGLVAASFLNGGDLDLEGLLVGDILSVTRADLVVIWGGAVLVLAGIVWRWRALLTATLNADLAVASGIDPKREQVLLALALAIVVAVSIKLVGALLIGAMLIIPAATARGMVRTPERMVVLATGIGMVAAIGGLISWRLADTPAGPSIVVVAAAFFAVRAVFLASGRA